jgi:hypothetical protein
MSETVHWEENSAKFCEDMEAEHTAPSYFERRWPCRVKVLVRIFEMKEEMFIFSSNSNKSDDTNSF